jgi:hypothetical protein
VLVTVGRKPVTEGWGEIDLDLAGRFIKIDDQCRTSMRGVYAIGDVTGEPMLAHRAMAQGEMVAEIVAGHKRSWDKRCIPAICFTDPEVVSADLTPDEAKAVTKEIIIGQFPFMANGRAMTKLGEDGFVRIVARADNHGTRHPGGWPGRVGTLRRVRPGDRDGRAAGRASPARSIRTRPRAKVSRKPRSRRWGTRCIFERAVSPSSKGRVGA